jgi:hypothetical protein
VTLTPHHPKTPIRTKEEKTVARRHYAELIVDFVFPPYPKEEVEAALKSMKKQ